MKIRVTNLIFLIPLTFLDCSTSQERYINRALTIMQKNSLVRKNINWAELRSKVRFQAQNNKDSSDAYKTISFALSLIGDNHSFLASPGRLKLFFGRDVEPPKIDHKLMLENVAYIKIPAFMGNDSLCSVFANNIQQTIKRYGQLGISNWIIDLRENYGGNMWPMLLGLSPLLGQGTHGFFVDDERNYFAWTCSSGVVYAGKKVMQKMRSPYTLEKPYHKIAILINGNTSSSGEAIALSFKGLKNIRYFGERTFGLTSSNNRFVLSDGAELYLTVSRFCDRDKNLCIGKIEPDEFVSNPEHVIEFATTWVKEIN